MLRFDIYLRGFGPGREPGAERLARAFGIPLEVARALVRSLPRVVKRGVPQPEIERYAKLLDAINADCELRPSPIAPAHVIAVGPAGEAEGMLEDSLPPPPPSPPVPSGVEPFALLGPNDTLVESQPAGSRVAPEEPAPIYVPGTGALPPSEPPAALELRAPDSRLMHVHAPTLRSFDTLSEAQAPPPRLSERTLPEIGRAPLAHEPSSAPLVLPAVAPLGPAFIAAPVAPASIMPAPIVPASVVPAPLASKEAQREASQDASYWRNAPTSRPPPGGVADQLQVERPSGPLQPRVPVVADAHTSVAPPGVWPGSLRESSRPPGAAGNTPLPPAAWEVALNKSGRPSARPSGRPSARPSVQPKQPPHEPVELTDWQRWGLRLLLGVLVFVALGSLRQCRAVDDDIEQGLARWQTRPSEQGAASPARGSQRVGGSGAALGPLASEWMHADLHQFAGGDKERVRGLVQRFEAAGALAVHVGVISELGLTEIAGELVVVLPTEPTQRAAVLAVHQAMLRATFGGLAPHSNPEGDVLHVTL